jgi:hypothetical protein
MFKKILVLYITAVLIYFAYQHNQQLSYQKMIKPLYVDKTVKNDTGYNFFADEETQLNIVPLEKYTLTGMVVSKKHYSTGWNAKVVPYDLAIVWGRLMEPDCLKTVDYWQSNRWYYYRWSKDFPIDQNYIIAHSANNHIISANSHILKAIEKINKNKRVTLEGYLVNLDGKNENRTIWWHSSLSRTDSGDGACELFYVDKAIIDGKIYR